ncbi:MAG: 50S ribosome-binding GTPase [Planctomycetes bacterium]|nr:50S ribosome-binding GTPase [Planctomycetota bacterium]
MSVVIPTCFMLATSNQTGPLAVFHLYGTEEKLVVSLDLRLALDAESRKFNPLQTREIKYGWLLSNKNEVLDEILLAKPADHFRILMVHGGAAIKKAVRNSLRENGFAEMEWQQAQADIIQPHNPLFQPFVAACQTETQVAAALDMAQGGASIGSKYPDSLFRFHRVVLAGPANAGKSSLLNRLAGYERAFVHELQGATRDVVDEFMDIGGFAVMLGDMPGWTPDPDELAAQAWHMATKRLRLADAVVFVIDGSVPWDGQTEQAAAAIRDVVSSNDDGEGKNMYTKVLVAVNKSDLPKRITGEPWRRFFPDTDSVAICSLPDHDAGEKMDAAIYHLLL